MSDLIECKKRLKSGGYAKGTVFADKAQIARLPKVLIPVGQLDLADDVDEQENIDTDVAPVTEEMPTLTHDQMVQAIEAKTGKTLHHNTKKSEESTLKKFLEVCGE